LAIRSLKSASQIDYWDKGLANIGIRVGPKRKTFLILLGPKRKRVVIGRYPDWSLQKARRKAMLMLASHGGGGQEVDVDFEDAGTLSLIPGSEQQAVDGSPDNAPSAPPLPFHWSSVDDYCAAHQRHYRPTAPLRSQSRVCRHPRIAQLVRRQAVS